MGGLAGIAEPDLDRTAKFAVPQGIWGAETPAYTP